MHEPPGYDCPFCRLLRGVETEQNRLDDIVWQDERTSAFISPKWWAANHGHALVIPNEHVENLYAIDDDLLGSVYATVKRIAIGLKHAYGCDGTSTRQHNEPAGNQDVWHFHVHVFPRYDGDRLYERHEEQRWAPPAERAPYAAKLRAALVRT
ncbi:MAG: histidine triad family protein [Gaiellaceae bacterium]|nr:histidine triad family protein [Gaiellaceae bacterium]